MKLGRTISELRNRRGIKQKKLAQLCGVSAAYLSQIEHDKRQPTLSVLDAISKKLHVPLPLLFFLSIDERDVPGSKRAIFTALEPTLRSLVDQFIEGDTVQSITGKAQAK